MRFRAPRLMTLDDLELL